MYLNLYNEMLMSALFKTGKHVRYYEDTMKTSCVFLIIIYNCPSLGEIDAFKMVSTFK